MLELIKVGNKKIDKNIKEFVFDGCHKIYLVSNQKEKQDMIKNGGYLKEDFIKNKETKLEECFVNTCSLRFINYGKSRDYEAVVPQFAMTTTFTYKDTIANRIVKHIINNSTGNVKVIWG